jgi:hypothetical protein
MMFYCWHAFGINCIDWSDWGIWVSVLIVVGAYGMCLWAMSPAAQRWAYRRWKAVEGRGDQRT